METATELLVVRAEPLCAETRLERQRGLLTPVAAFYARNNFPVPDSWPGLTVDGEVEEPLFLDAAALAGLPHRRLVATVECAGNGRRHMAQPASGEQWGLGAVSTAEWEGFELRQLLEKARVRDGVVEIVFEAADGFARSLPLERALHPDTLLATGMNGETLPRKHGGPVRVVVPGWYGMAAVKWVRRVAAVKEPFRGHYQVERYVVEGRPVREMKVRAVIAEPVAGAVLAAGEPATIRGYAWTGSGRVAAVEVSTNGGASWVPAELRGDEVPYAWREWNMGWTPAAGAHRLLAVAATDRGERQPVEPGWNELGYENNSAVAVDVVANQSPASMAPVAKGSG
jgi:DMSO/TMAO reductase YedYZ molybdopterin-dependent catalytic subunit